MEWFVLAASAMLALAVTFAVTVRKGIAKNSGKKAEMSAFKKGGTRCQANTENSLRQREREREAHYMRNFWSYDGSEQLDWDEEG